MPQYQLRNKMVVEGPHSPEKDEFEIISMGDVPESEKDDLLEDSGMVALAYFMNGCIMGDPLTYKGGCLGVGFDVMKEINS